MEADLQVSLKHFEEVVRPVYKNALARAAEVLPSAIEITKLEEKEIGNENPLLRTDASPINSSTHPETESSTSQSHSRGLKQQTVLVVVSKISISDESSASDLVTVREKVEVNWDSEVATELDTLGVAVLSVHAVIVLSEEDSREEVKEVFQ